MKDEILNQLIPIIAVLIFIFVVIYVRKTNPENKKIRTRTSFDAIKRKEVCPRCKIKMKKKWVTHAIGLSSIESDSVYENEAEPEFICKKCGYKIDAKFTRR